VSTQDYPIKPAHRTQQGCSHDRFLQRYCVVPSDQFDPVAILKRADESRGNQRGITWTIDLTHWKNEEMQKRGNSRDLKVKARAYDFLAIYNSPPKQKGDKILRSNGNMWFCTRSASKPVPISQRQKILGNAAYGDIASTNYAEDYKVTVVKEGGFEGEACWVFYLESRPGRKTTHDRLKYWVSKKRRVGLRAEYFAVSGKIFKSANMKYELRTERGGERKPFISEIRIFENLVSKNTTVLTFSSPSLQDLIEHFVSIGASFTY